MDRLRWDTFRDWLDLLIAPFLVPAACKVFHARQSTRTTLNPVVPDKSTSCSRPPFSRSASPCWV
jgi:hypothetical protein